MTTPTAWSRWQDKIRPSRVTEGWPVLPLLILFGLNAVDELDRTAFAILTPNIRDHFNLDLGGILGLVGGVTFLALGGQVLVGYFADRRPPRAHGDPRRCDLGIFHGRHRTGARHCLPGDGARGLRARQGGHRSHAQLPDRRLLPARSEAQGLRIPSLRQRRRPDRGAARGRRARVLLRLATSLHRPRRADDLSRGPGNSAPPRARARRARARGDGRQ